jgi:hypothetical protein
VISSDIQNVVADSFYQGQVTFTYFPKQPVNAYPAGHHGWNKSETQVDETGSPSSEFVVAPRVLTLSAPPAAILNVV